MALTLEDIAQLAGVSRATVSRVVNGYEHISPEVRARVWQVVKEHNYQPHPAARTLVTRRTLAMGLLVPEGAMRIFADAFFPLLIQGIAETCNRIGYYLTLVLETDPTDRAAFYRRVLTGQTVDGIITTSPPIGDPLLPMILESRVRAVSVGRQPAFPDMPFVDVDNRSGGYQATRYLVERGHTRIATITGPLNSVTGQDRLRGYRDALEEGGIAYDPALVAEGDFNEAAARRGMTTLLKQRPTAVFAASDKMALGAIGTIGEAGLGVPDDVSVVGFDNFPLAPGVEPLFTTVAQPAIELGATAAELLIEILEQPDESDARDGRRANHVEGDSRPERSRLLPTRLIERNTVRQLASNGASPMPRSTGGA